MGTDAMPRSEWIAEGARVLRAEAQALLALADSFDAESFGRAVDLLHGCTAPVVVAGLGKSGHIAAKVAATLASTGTPAFHLHAAEALHGDLGMASPGCGLLVFSQSGTTEEALRLIPYFRHLRAPIVAITGGRQSPLAEAADAVLWSRVAAEACPLNLAPTSSTTAQLALGDALAIALMRRRGFTAEEFAMRHPRGALGRRLLMRVEDLMRKGEAAPVVGLGATLAEAVDELNRKRLGAVSIVDGEGRLAGIFTDGDLRRLWVARGTIEATRPVAEVMVRNPKRIVPDALGVAAVELMEEHKITVLPVVDPDGRMVGFVHLHQLVEAGLTTENR
jgi:arabinose-5-phosphate isomerase